MLRLKPNEVCSKINCLYQSDMSLAGLCQGTNPNRSTFFDCEFVDNDGIVDNNKVIRNSVDKTGHMVLLNE